MDVCVFVGELFTDCSTVKHHFLPTIWVNQPCWVVDSLGFVFVGDVFTDSTMVNHHQTTIWVNMFGTFSKYRTRNSKIRFMDDIGLCPVDVVGYRFWLVFHGFSLVWSDQKIFLPHVDESHSRKQSQASSTKKSGFMVIYIRIYMSNVRNIF